MAAFDQHISKTLIPNLAPQPVPWLQIILSIVEAVAPVEMKYQ